MPIHFVTMMDHHWGGSWGGVSIYIYIYIGYTTWLFMAGKMLCTTEVRQTRHSDSAQPEEFLKSLGRFKGCAQACGGGHNTKRESLFKNASQKTCGRHERHARHDRHDAVDEALKHKDQRWSEIAKDRGRATKAKHDVQIEAMRHTWCKWECKNTKGLCNLWITDKDAVSRLWIAINFEFVLFENPTRTGGCALCSQL